MTNRIYFSTFDLLHDVPNICGVCASNPPMFRYEFSDGDEQRAEYMKGFCCASCASKLLSVLEDVERQEWAREQAALESMTSN
jgi:hypothetical protein